VSFRNYKNEGHTPDRSQEGKRDFLRLLIVIMPLIQLSTLINAPIEVCFNLSRSIDLHKDSMKHTGEKAVSGVQSGLIGLNETVTWRAKHFGVVMQMTIKITETMPFISFTDEQIKGPFKKLKHRHIFQHIADGQTKMFDEFEFESPAGFIGRWVDEMILTDYMTKLLKRRNEVIKAAAENFHHNN